MEQYIHITLKNASNEMDLKIPFFLSVADVLKMIATVFHIEITPATRIQVEPLGRILDPARTLEQEGVTNGSLFTVI